MDENPLETISRITEFNDISDFMKDPQLDRAMDLAIKCMANPDLASTKAPRLIVELQALSFKFSMKAVEYSTIKKDRAGTENNYKKNVYHSVRDALNDLVSALKYVARS